MEVDVVSLASELPNDNPALHRGARWVCLEVTGLPVAVLPPVDASTTTPTAAPATTDDSVDVLRVPAARISGIVGLGETPRDESELDERPRDESERDVEVHLDERLHGDIDDETIIVEELPPLDQSATLEGLGLAPPMTIVPPPCGDAWIVLVSTLADIASGAGSPHVASALSGLLLDGQLASLPPAIAALTEGGIVLDGALTPAFLAQRAGWRALLLGTSDDFDACGQAMLDEWAAELLARMLGAPSQAVALRRELRSRGVAAFGLVEAA